MTPDPLRFRGRCAKGRPRAALFVVGAALAAAGFATEAPLVARWRGGELTLARFHDLYDSQGTALLAGGERLRTEVAKAVFREIEGARALTLGLDRDPDLLADLAAWRTRRLAGLARKQIGLTTAPTSEEIALAWSTRHREILPVVTAVDFDVLFVRCPLRARARPACEERLRGLRARIARGEAFEALAAEEKTFSGPANGSFSNVALGSLMVDLAVAAATLPVGEISAPLPTPSGLFTLRVSRRGERPPLALAAIEPLVRNFLFAERERQAVAILPAPAGQADSPEARLAAYAAAAGLDKSASFLADEARQRSWLLADAAFERDPEQAPRPETIRAAIEAEPSRWRRPDLRLAVIDARGDRLERRAALENAARLADELDGASAETSTHHADTARLFDLVEQRPAGEPPVALRTLDGVDTATLDPLLVETLAKLSPGGWGGPVPVARLDGGKVERDRAAPGADYDGLAFVLLRSYSPADEAAVAETLQRATRAQMGGSVASFMAQFGAARGVELLVP